MCLVDLIFPLLIIGTEVLIAFLNETRVVSHFDSAYAMFNCAEDWQVTKMVGMLNFPFLD